MMRQLEELDGVLELLERMNVDHQTEVPTELTDLIEALGVPGTKGLEPKALMPQVLDRQKVLRRQLASMRRTKAS